MRRTLIPAALLTVLAMAGCADAPTGTPREVQGGAPLASLSLGDQIDQMINDFFSRGPQTATATRWGNVKNRLAAGDEQAANKFLVDMAKWVDLRTRDITPPPGETKEQAATRLIRAMATYVHAGPNAELPEAGPDMTFAIVETGDEAIIVTPQKRAGLALDEGSTDEDRIIVISQEPVPYPEHCSGPLPTTLCQYPLFYRFESFPNVKLSKSGRFAVCMVGHAHPRQPLDYPGDETVHDRMRLAHNKPEAGAEHPNGTIVGDIEILPKAAVQTGIVECEPVHAHLDMGPARRALHAVWHFAERVVTPRKLYAWDSGPEHESDFFSNFNGVDPESGPDLAVTGLAAPTGAATGSEIGISYVIENRSRANGGEATASSDPTTATVYLSPNPTLGGGEIALGSPVPVPALAPDSTHSVVQAVTLPALSGDFHLLVHVAPNPGQPEIDLANNLASSAIAVVPIEVLFCPGGPPGSIPVLQDAVNAVAAGGTVLVCDGVHQVDSVAVNKPLTLRSENDDGATLRDDPAAPPGPQGGRPAIAIGDFGSGTVRIARINFEVTRSAVLIGSNTGVPADWDQVVLDTVSITGLDTLTTFVVRSFISSNAGAKLEVRHSSFQNLFLGVFAISGEVNVRNSTFTDTDRGIVYSFSGLAPTTAATGTAENNIFNRCGLGGCIRALGRGGYLIKGNSITSNVTADSVRLAGISVQLSANAPGLPSVIENNVVTGARRPGTPATEAGWTFSIGINIQPAATTGAFTTTVRGNDVSGAWRGFIFSLAGAADAFAHDNVVTNSGTAFDHFNSGGLVYVRNDTDSLEVSSFHTTGTLTRDYTCNWWGTPGGPSSVPPAAAPSTYTPWALEPIAGKPLVVCPP